MKVFLLLILLVFVSSCGDDKKGDNTPNACANVNCDEWKSCNDGICVLKSGRCETQDDCNQIETCNLTLHQCINSEDPCNGITCSNHGTCSDNEGTPICICETGFHAEGLSCIEDNISEPCLGVTCSNHGTCQVDSLNRAFCECEEGYEVDETDKLKCIIKTSCITHQLGTSDADTFTGMIVDTEKNIYVVYNSVNESEETGGLYKTSVVKMNQNFETLWTVVYGGGESEFVSSDSVAIDSEGNIYISGTTNGIEGQTPFGFENDAFIAKISTNGEKIFTKLYGTESIEESSYIAISSDIVYITGKTTGNLDGKSNIGDSDIFIIKTNLSGEKISSNLVGTTGGETVKAIFAKGENIYLTGYTYGTFENNENYGDDDIFTLKLNDELNVIWVKQLGTVENEFGYAITVDSLNNVYVTGEIYIKHDLSTTEGNTFLLKYDATGNFNSINQYSMTAGNGICVNSSNDIFIFGGLGIVSYFSLNNPAKTSVSSQEGGREISKSIYVDSENNIYLGGTTNGTFSGNTSFGKADAFVSVCK